MGDIMTVSEIEKKARRILRDTEREYRWTSSEMREALQEGVYALNAVRPETRYVGGHLVDGVALPESDSAPVDVPDRYAEALVYYVVHKCYLTDDADTVNQQLAEAYLGKFNTKSQL